jgi:hypothetical protein
MLRWLAHANPASRTPIKYVVAFVRQLSVVPIAVLSLLVLPLNFISATTAKPDRASDDKAAIRATIIDYIEGYYLNDAARMERSLHPHYLKQTSNGFNGELTMTDKTGMEMLQEVQNKESNPCAGTEGRDSLFSISMAMLPPLNWSPSSGPTT